MKFSVVLSNYNGREFLREAVQSVLDQEYDDYELILVDDGSTDGSQEIVGEFAETRPDRVRALLESTNEGQGAGFNKGVEASCGEFVAFLDSDDLWMPCKLGNLARFIDITGPAALYQHNLFFMRDGIKTRDPFRALLPAGDLYTETCQTLKLPAFVATSGLAFPRSILDKVLPIPLAFRTCADGYLTRTSFCHGRVASVCEGWGYYRVHGGNCVFDNPTYDPRDYCNNLLIPALNAYYEKIGCELRFPSRVKVKPQEPPRPPALSPEAGPMPADKMPARAEEPVLPRKDNTHELELVPSTDTGNLKAFIVRLLNLSPMDAYRKLKKMIFRG